MIYVKSYYKHLLCFSFAAVLLLAGQACKKQDFRDSFTGLYFCERYSRSWGYQGYYDTIAPDSVIVRYRYCDKETILGHDYIRVTKVFSSTKAVEIKGKVYKLSSAANSSEMIDFDFCSPLVARFSGDSFYCEFDCNCMGLGGGYLDYYKGIKVY